MLGRVVALALAASAVFGGCVASGDESHVGTYVQSARIERNATEVFGQSATTTTAAPPTTLATAPSPASRVAAPSGSRPRVSKPAPAGNAHAPRSAPGAESAPVWEHYGRQLTGGNYMVARALGPGLDVSPSREAAPATTLSNPLASGAPRVVVVIQQQGEWLQVLLPVRPNGSLGWIRRADVEITRVHHRVEIDRAAHRLRVFDGSEAVVVDEPIAVGKPSTPTPSGQFFTVELLQPSNPGGAYGPYAFTLSAYSEVYQTFGSGDGAVGLHGTNEPSSIGRDASHGCVRLHNGAVQHLAGMLPLGAPVFIR